MPKKQIHILLIEDNPSDVAQVRQILDVEPQSFMLTVCRRLDEGLAHLQKNAVDLILLDLSLPDGHGLDVLLQLNARSYAIPIIILTSTDDKLVASIALKQGAQDYLIKETLIPDLVIRAIHYALYRKQVELELDVQRQNFHSIVEKSDDGLVVVDEYGTVQYLNHTAEEFLDVSRETLTGHSLGYQILTSETSEIDIRRANGQKGLGEYRALPTEWQGKASSLIIIRDMTDQKKAEKLRDDFIQTVSHELRTPLTSIRESICQLYDEILGDVNADQKKFLALCLRNTDYLKRIVDNLLDIAKYESGRATLEISRFDMVALIRSLVESFHPRAEKYGIELSCGSLNTSQIVFADKDKITQVWMNLIDNALKFTKKGFVKLDVEKDSHNLIYSVSDSGRGIEANDLSHIFEKFIQFGKLMSPEEKGTGLGLAITKGIIELHGGKVWAESTPNQGSRFSFTLPLTMK